MASLSKQFIKSSYLRAALFNNHANAVMNYISSNNKSLFKSLSTNSVLNRKEHIRAGVQRNEDSQEKKGSAQQQQQQQRRPQQQRDNRDRDNRDGDRQSRSEEGNRPSQPLILVPLNSLEDPSINREALLEAARALQLNEYKNECREASQAGSRANPERGEESRNDQTDRNANMASFEPQRYNREQLCDPNNQSGKNASRRNAERQDQSAQSSTRQNNLDQSSQDSRRDQSSQDSRRNTSRQNASSKDGLDVAVVVPLNQVRAQSQRLEAEKQPRSDPLQRNRRGEERSQSELVQAYLISSEDGRAANNNNNNPNKVALPLDDQIIQQLKCLSISGMNLDIITEVPDINGAIKRLEKCKSSSPKSPQESEDQNDIQELPFEMETKINGTLLISPQEMKESGLDKIDPDELNSRISNITSNICLIALQNGLNNVQCFEDQGQSSPEPMICEGTMAEKKDSCPSNSSKARNRSPSNASRKENDPCSSDAAEKAKNQSPQNAASKSDKGKQQNGNKPVCPPKESNSASKCGSQKRELPKC